MKTAATQPPPVTSTAPAAVLEPTSGAASRLAGRVSPYGRIVLPIVGTLIVFAGQLVEDAQDSAPLQMLEPAPILTRWLLVGFVAYLFGIWGVEERVVERSLRAARPAVLIDDARFAAYARRMETLPVASEIVLILASAVMSIGLFVVLRADLLIDDPVTHLSRSLPFGPGGILILAGYTVLGWAFLRLVYGTARLASALGALARERLRINVFDTSDLLPFGNIALALALAPAGAIAILIVALGRPTTLVGWSVLVEATAATVLALLLPLRGIHRQMAAAKYAAFTRLGERVEQVYTTATDLGVGVTDDWGHLSGATGTVMQLRKAVQEMTTWPFRDTLALSRALLIAAAPLIYTTLSEIIRIIWLAPLTK